ncbi:MAG: RNA-guided pseudouridylation complex pseudouridine synthase subunit Cbf5 [Candidatus Pacearchaeota archaeon]
MEKTIKELLNFGIILIDKPSGPTSFDISNHIKKELGLKKTSHFGTLDPKVGGVLPIALGRACRLTGFFLGHNKEYVGIIRTHKDISLRELQDIINKNFIGKIKQLPPVRSRVKREIREREVISFKVLEKKEKDFLFITEVQGGTYIRKICSDLGNLIGGAHMLELRRTKAGIFSESDENFVNLYDFERVKEEWKSGDSKKLKKIIIPAEEAIKKVFEVVQIKETSIKKLMTGKFIKITDLFDKKEFLEVKKEIFAAFFKEKFIGIYKKIEKGDEIAKPEFVFN